MTCVSLSMLPRIASSPFPANTFSILVCLTPPPRLTLPPPPVPLSFSLSPSKRQSHLREALVCAWQELCSR